MEWKRKVGLSLYGCFLQGADLAGANLTGTGLYGAKVEGTFECGTLRANFTRANWWDASFMHPITKEIDHNLRAWLERNYPRSESPAEPDLEQEK